MQQGEVKWFDDQKGFGFIEQEMGEDLFVHYSDIEQEGYKTLNEGQEVEFEIEETEKGLAAKEVQSTGEEVVSTDDPEPTETEKNESSFDTDTLENNMNNTSDEEF